MRKKNVVILGSTGTIGINTLKVIERFSDQFNVLGLSAFNNGSLLAKQVTKFKPKYAAIGEKGRNRLQDALKKQKVKILDVDEDLEFLVSLRDVDIVVIGMKGSIALGPFLKAVQCGKLVAPANKEALVIAGEIIMAEARKAKATVIPIDSEQSAIFQCLDGNKRNELKKVHLTASGGALLNVPKKKFDTLSVKQILAHPRWKMGKKITVDSATLMNKGFEIIEALRLFDLDVKDIDVLVHPEAIIHSMVEYKDGSIIAQLGVTDMRLPIQFALTYPKRLTSGLKSMDFAKLGQLTFQKPDMKKFPALSLAVYAAKKGGTLPSVLNAADEVAVDAFLEGRIKFTDIYKIVEKVLLKHKKSSKNTLKQILQADVWAREESQRLIYNSL